MTVEIKVIPEGISGLRSRTTSTKRRKRTTPQVGSSQPTYHQQAAKTATRMDAENKKETQRYTPKRIRQILCSTIKAGTPDLTATELDDLVNQMLPVAMESYRGKGLLIQEPSPEVQAVWTARKAERKRIVKALKIRRKSRGEED